MWERNYVHLEKMWILRFGHAVRPCHILIFAWNYKWFSMHADFAIINTTVKKCQITLLYAMYTNPPKCGISLLRHLENGLDPETLHRGLPLKCLYTTMRRAQWGGHNEEGTMRRAYSGTLVAMKIEISGWSRMPFMTIYAIPQWRGTFA